MLPSDADLWLVLPPTYLAHAFWANRNAGARVLIQLGITLGPPGLGSGKLGTPCDRMHSASLTAGSPLATLLDVPEDPQPHSAAAQLAPASAIHRLWRWLPRVSVILSLLTSKPWEWRLAPLSFYATTGNRDVTAGTSQLVSQLPAAHELHDLPGDGLSARPRPAQSAIKTCKIFDSRRGRPNVSESKKLAQLQLAQCMRKHGTPNFPDPTFPSGGGISWPIVPGLDLRSPAANQAGAVCSRN